jgi:hypothetical protein
LKKVPVFLWVFVVLMTIILTSSYGCGAGEKNEPKETPAPTSTPPSLDWPMFRSNSQHTGVATSTITLPLTLRWTFQAGDVLMSSPAVSGDRLFVDSYALDATTGKKLWEFQTEGPVTTSPAVSGGRVFVGSYEMKIYALDATTGKKLWEFQTDN